MKRPTRSRPFTGSGLSRPTPSRAVPRPAASPATGAREPQRGGAAASSPPSAEDATLPAATAEDLGIPRRDANIFAGRYRIEKKLGQGGMGSVFLATQLAIDRKVAIKVLENVSEDGVMVARFQREARVIAKLQHPNIVNLIDFGENERGQLFLVMEYIDGEPLTSLVKREAPLDPTRLVRIALQITEALAAAHDINVIHRDLKPDNIMMSGGTRSDYVKILDFGIAKVKRTDPGQDTVQTRAGLIVGSLRYISPEQVESKEVTFQTDFYALGGILYELLCGHLVFDHASPADCAIAHLTEAPRPPTIDGVPLTGPLVDLIMQCLEKDPTRRPPSAHVVIEMLRACEHAPIHQRFARGSQDELPTDKHADVHHSDTIDLGPTRRRPSAPTVPPADPRSRPTSRPVSRPTATVNADSLDGYGPDGPDVPGRTDCSIDLPRRPEAPRPGRVADTPLWSPPEEGSAPAHTVTQHAPLQRPPARRGANPILWFLAVALLAGVGVVLYLVASGPPAEGPAPTPPTDPVGEQAPATPPAPVTTRAPEAIAEEAPDVVSAEADAAPPTPSASVAANAVRLESEPLEVEIFLGDLSLGPTPVTLTWDGQGTAPRLRAAKAGFRQLTLTLRRGDVGQVRKLTLEPLR